MTRPEPPSGSVVLDRDGQAWQRVGGRWWTWRTTTGPHLWKPLNDMRGPLRVIWQTSS